MDTPNIQMIANIGCINIATNNPNLDGTGVLGTVLTAGNATNAGGTLIRSVTIKATGNTSLGMVRLFISDGNTNYLYREVMVPAVDQTAVVRAFASAISEPFMLQPNYSLLASTQNAESFNVYADGKDIIVCDC